MADATADVATNGTKHASEGRPTLADVGAEPLFEKILSACDAASKGRIVLPKKAAVDHMPDLDGKPSISVACRDSLGNEHMLTHRFWMNVKSKMYLLEGLGPVFRNYRVTAGDILCFGRTTSGSMVVCTRKPGPGDVRRTRKRAATPEPKIVKQQPKKVPPQPKRGKRQRLQRADSVESEASEEINYFEPLVDGVFRAMPPNGSCSLANEVSCHGSYWSATIYAAGEYFQAFYSTCSAAEEAFEAAVQDVGDCEAS